MVRNLRWRESVEHSTQLYHPPVTTALHFLASRWCRRASNRSSRRAWNPSGPCLDAVDDDPTRPRAALPLPNPLLRSYPAQMPLADAVRLRLSPTRRTSLSAGEGEEMASATTKLQAAPSVPFDAHAGEISNRNSSHIVALCRRRLPLPAPGVCKRRGKKQIFRRYAIASNHRLMPVLGFFTRCSRFALGLHCIAAAAAALLVRIRSLLAHVFEKFRNWSTHVPTCEL
jgi:hypothetical protein